MDKMTPFDKKVLKLIHKQILDPHIKDFTEWEGKLPITLNDYTVDDLIEDVDLLKDIYDFLNGTMELGPSASQGFIDLLVSNLM